MKNKIKVVYITGVFRSGSTVFDTLLGNLPEVESVGELVNIYQHAWTEGHYCACGVEGDSCPFWGEVKEHWAKTQSVSDLHDILDRQSRVERFRRWPLLVGQKVKRTKAFELYAQDIYRLFAAIADQANSFMIVDSSKNPGRALALSMVKGIDLKVIHLVRDGRGVSWSCLKSFEVDRAKGLQMAIDPVPTWKTAVRWLAINLSSTIVCALLGSRAMRVRYEDVVDDSDVSLKEIGEFLSVDSSGLSQSLSSGGSLELGHTIAGNRVRMGGRFVLKNDNEWHTKLPDKDRKQFWLIAGLLARFYGYKKNIGL